MNIKPNTLCCANALTLMERLENESIDFIFLDMPWFIHFSQKKNLEHKQLIFNILQQAKRIVSANGSLCVFSETEVDIELTPIIDRLFSIDDYLKKYEVKSNRRRFGNGLIIFTISFITKDTKRAFFNNKINRTDEELKRMFPYVDEVGKYRITLHPYQRDENNQRIKVKRYANENSIFKEYDNIWEDIDFINPNTQGLPTTLLERILQIATQSDYIVLEPFAGRGVMVDVAEKMGLNWIASEGSQEGIDIIKNRLVNTDFSYLSQTDLEAISVVWNDYEEFDYEKIISNLQAQLEEIRKVTNLDIQRTYLQTNYPFYNRLQAYSKEQLAFGLYCLEVSIPMLNIGNYASAILLFCKALEFEVKKILKNFKANCSFNRGRYPYIENYNYKNFRSFLYDEKITFAQMIHTIKEAFVNTETLFVNFKNFLLSLKREIEWQTIIDKTQILITPRNEAAHTTSMTEQEAIDSKELVFEALTLIV